jgi:photosystem II stability/assembly factor-like uncharacterized protein
MFYGTSCIKVISNNIEGKPLQQFQTTSENKKKDLKPEVIKSKLLNEKSTIWRVSTINFEHSKTNQQYFFLNEKTGWAYAENLYETKNSGMTWDFVLIPKPENTVISHVFFTNENRGWMVVQPYERNYTKFRENHFLLFETVGEGKFWSKKLELEGVVIDEIKFTNEKIGWITGRKYLNTSPETFEIYMLITNDGGKTWNEVSANLNKIVLENQTTSNPYIEAVSYSGDQLILISGKKQLFQTNDFGNSWSFLENIPDEDLFTSIGVKNTGLLNDNSLWLIGSSHHYNAEGDIIKRVDNHWEQYKLDDIYFSDGMFLSNDEVIICGYRVKKDGNVGVILYSSDKGKTWVTLTEQTKTDNIMHLQKLDKSTIIAWDNESAIYMVTRL